MKKNTISKMLLASLLVGGISLTSCGGPSTSFSGSYDEDDLSGSITVWWPGGSTALESVINEAVDRYETLHPQVTIDIRFQSTADFYFAYNMALLGMNSQMLLILITSMYKDLLMMEVLQI